MREGARNGLLIVDDGLLSVEEEADEEREDKAEALVMDEGVRERLGRRGADKNEDAEAAGRDEVLARRLSLLRPLYLTSEGLTTLPPDPMLAITGEPEPDSSSSRIKLICPRIVRGPPVDDIRL